MWLFLPSGFYSVVAHREAIRTDAPEGGVPGIPYATEVIVRCRELAALEYFAHACRPDVVKILETPRADYPYRAVVPTVVWSEFLADEAASIMATNFKSHVETVRRGPDRFTGALHRVWAVLADAFLPDRPRPALFELQDGPGWPQRRSTTSNNGGQTRPLTPHTLAELEDIAKAPRPRSSVNAGVADRLTRQPDPLCKVVDLPSPFKKHRGGTCPHLQITEAGRAALKGECPAGWCLEDASECVQHGCLRAGLTARGRGL